jgi:hypothetical protein
LRRLDAIALEDAVALALAAAVKPDGDTAQRSP